MLAVPLQASVAHDVPTAVANTNQDASSSRMPSAKSGKRKAQQASTVQSVAESCPPLAAQSVLAIKPKRVKQVARRALPRQETGLWRKHSGPSFPLEALPPQYLSMILSYCDTVDLCLLSTANRYIALLLTAVAATHSPLW
jgi:hypothetical protein